MEKRKEAACLLINYIIILRLIIRQRYTIFADDLHLSSIKMLEKTFPVFVYGQLQTEIR